MRIMGNALDGRLGAMLFTMWEAPIVTPRGVRTLYREASE